MISGGARLLGKKGLSLSIYSSTYLFGRARRRVSCGESRFVNPRPYRSEKKRVEGDNLIPPICVRWEVLQHLLHRRLLPPVRDERRSEICATSTRAAGLSRPAEEREHANPRDMTCAQRHGGEHGP